MSRAPWGLILGLILFNCLSLSLSQLDDNFTDDSEWRGAADVLETGAATRRDLDRRANGNPVQRCEPRALQHGHNHPSSSAGRGRSSCAYSADTPRSAAELSSNCRP